MNRQNRESHEEHHDQTKDWIPVWLRLTFYTVAYSVMGLSASSLSIELENDHGKNEDKPLPAGSRLQGNLIVEIHRDVKLPPPLSHEEAQETPALLKLRIYGKEKVCMDRMKAKVNLDKKQQQQGHSSSWQRPRKSAERQIIDHTVRWTKFPNVEGFTRDNDIVLAGVYVFPFDIDLPTMLPSSTYYPLEAVQSLSKRGCRIQYKMDAQLIYGSKTAAKKSSYLWLSAASSSGTTALTRRQPTPCMVEPISHEVSGMLSKGNIYFGAGKCWPWLLPIDRMTQFLYWQRWMIAPFAKVKTLFFVFPVGMIRQRRSNESKSISMRISRGERLRQTMLTQKRACAAKRPRCNSRPSSPCSR
jgi:hypothetical protein